MDLHQAESVSERRAGRPSRALVRRWEGGAIHRQGDLDGHEDDGRFVLRPGQARLLGFRAGDAALEGFVPGGRSRGGPWVRGR